MATSLCAKGDHEPAAREHFHIEAVCVIEAELDVLFSFSGVCQPEIFGEEKGRKVAHQPMCNLGGRAVAENGRVVPVLRVFDSLGNRHKVWPVEGAGTELGVVAREVVGVNRT